MPWGHFLVAVLPFVVYYLFRYRRVPPGPAILALGFGSQFPDLIDKPLAWQFGVLINGRMFMHSLVFALPLSGLVLTVAWQTNRKLLGSAFVFGYLLHIPGDFYHAFVGQHTYFPSNMLWPLLPPRGAMKPEFVEQPSLIVLSAWDIGLIGAGTILIAYAGVSAFRARTGLPQ